MELALRTASKRRNRQGCVTGVVASLAVLLFPQGAGSATSDSDQAAYTASIAPEPAGDIRIQFVKDGLEGLELSAKLSEDGGIIQRPVLWTVKQADGPVVYTGDEPVANFASDPGDYEVTARYGTVTVKRNVTLLQGQRLGVSFVLNVGGLRVLPRVGDLARPSARPETRIFATSGLSNGQLIAVSTIPGEIVRLGAGSYRIESRFNPGNVIKETTVDVRPGLLSAIELDLPAGVARLAARATGADVVWTISARNGEALPPITGTAADVVLKPGAYTASAIVGGTESRLDFSISPGESKDVVLSN